MEDRLPAELSVAAVNGPRATVVSGAVAALESLRDGLVAKGVNAKLVPVDYASHSAHMAAIEDELTTALAGIVPRSGAVPFFSSVTADWLDTAELDAGYWYRNLRERVRFAPAVHHLVGENVAGFVEISPHPVLTVGMRDCVDEAGSDVLVAESLRRDDGGVDRFMASALRLYTHGAPIRWDAVFPDARLVELPTYPFVRQRFWMNNAAPTDSGRVVDTWCYRVDWVPVRAFVPSVMSGTWLLVVPYGAAEHPWVRAVMDVLVRRGWTSACRRPTC